MQAEFFLKREQKNQLEYGRGYHANRSVHFHSQIEVYFVLEGKIEVWINDRHRVLGAGEMSVALSYDAHGYREVMPSHYAYLIIPTDLLHEFLPLFTDRRMGDPFIHDPEVFEKTYRAFCELSPDASELSTRGYIYVILGALLSRLPTETHRETQNPRSHARLLMYISEHFREELSLSQVATAFGYHPSYLSRLFRETFGISFHRYVTMIRLREAILLLRGGQHSVTACAMESGFGSVRTFYRSFLDEFGCTPKEYLESVR